MAVPCVRRRTTMSFFRFGALGVLLAISSACSSQSEAPAATPATTQTPSVVGPSHAPSALGAPARDAFDLLHVAEAFEDTHVGYSGELSRYVAAFRVVLADPHAGAGFHALVADATPAGRLYGAAGLYYADPSPIEARILPRSMPRSRGSRRRADPFPPGTDADTSWSASST
jgi:hypothetical protein